MVLYMVQDQHVLDRNLKQNDTTLPAVDLIIFNSVSTQVLSAPLSTITEIALPL